MIRLAVSVEGRTEEEFVKTVLAGHLREYGVEPVPILLGRARGVSGGGNVSVERLAPEMRDLYRSFNAVTSLVDFYGFRGREDRETVDALENRLGEALRRAIREYDSRRVIPYIQQHEFESLLFSDVDSFAVFQKLMLVRPQAGLLVDEDGRIGMDFIGRYEALQDSFAQVCRRIGIPGQRLAIVNATVHRPWEDYGVHRLARLLSQIRQHVAAGGADPLPAKRRRARLVWRARLAKRAGLDQRPSRPPPGQ